MKHFQTHLMRPAASPHTKARQDPTRKAKQAASLLLCMLSHFSRVQLFTTPWTIACLAPLSVGFSKQEYWRRLPCPPPRDLTDPGIEPVSLTSSALAGGFFITSASWEVQLDISVIKLVWRWKPGPLEASRQIQDEWVSQVWGPWCQAGTGGRML